MNHRFLGFERDHKGQHLSILFTVRFLRHFIKIFTRELENKAGLKIKNLATMRTKFALRFVFPPLGFHCLELLTESNYLGGEGSNILHRVSGPFRSNMPVSCHLRG